MLFATGLEGGCCSFRMIGIAQRISHISLIPLWLSHVNRPARAEREKKRGTRATPLKSGGGM